MEIRLASFDVCENGDRWRAYLNLQWNSKEKKVFIKDFTFSHIGYSKKDAIRHKDRKTLEKILGKEYIKDKEIDHNWQNGSHEIVSYLEHCKTDRVSITPRYRKGSSRLKDKKVRRSMEEIEEEIGEGSWE